MYTSLFGAGKSKSMAVLILQRNSGTRSFADLLLWLDTRRVLGRIGRLVGDQECYKSSFSHTRERRQLLNKCQLVMPQEEL